MPELPDLEAFKKTLDLECLNQKVADVRVYRDKRLNVSGQELIEALTDSEIIEIKREGKEMHFLFANKQVLGVHLMLNGKFNLVENDEEVKYKNLTLEFEGGKCFVLSDSRALLNLHLNPTVSSIPDALGDNFTLAYFEEQLAKNRTMVLKGFLVDQKIVRGIGNAYADEILWASRISPESYCGKIPKAGVKKLYETMPKILKEAIEEILKANPGIINGEFRDFLKIHVKKKELSPTGKPILCKEIAKKKTYYTEEQVCYK